jgi:hypothetical protein
MQQNEQSFLPLRPIVTSAGKRQEETDRNISTRQEKTNRNIGNAPIFFTMTRRGRGGSRGGRGSERGGYGGHGSKRTDLHWHQDGS